MDALTPIAKQLLVELILPILATLLSALAAWALTLINARLKVNLGTAKDSAVRALIRNAIAGAEEWAARQLKTNPGAAPITGKDKAMWVRDRVLEATKHAFPDDFDKILDEEIAHVSGAGATGERTVL